VQEAVECWLTQLTYAGDKKTPFSDFLELDRTPLEELARSHVQRYPISEWSQLEARRRHIFSFSSNVWKRYIEGVRELV
jgi:hypothetical protein